MRGRPQTLDVSERRLVALVGAFVIVSAIVLGLTSIGDRDGSASVDLATGPGRRFDLSSADMGDQDTTTVRGTSSIFGTSDAQQRARADAGATAASTMSGGASTGAAATTGAGGGATTGNTTATTKASTTTKAPTTANSPTTTKAPVPTQAPATTQPPPVTQPPSSSGPCNPGGGNTAANQIANLFCQYRADQGLPPVTRNATLDRSAAEWAQHMGNIGKLEHRPDAAAVVHAACCPGWGENVGFTTHTANEVWNRWLGSSDHLKNIRVNKTGEYGVGSFVDAGGQIWLVHMFGWY